MFAHTMLESVGNLNNELMGTNQTLDKIKEAEVEHDEEDDNINF